MGSAPQELEPAKARFQAFCSEHGLSSDTLRKMEGEGEASSTQATQAKALKDAVSRAERTLRLHTAAAHAMLLLSILNLLREEARVQQPTRSRFHRIWQTPRSRTKAGSTP